MRFLRARSEPPAGSLIVRARLLRHLHNLGPCMRRWVGRIEDTMHACKTPALSSFLYNFINRSKRLCTSILIHGPKKYVDHSSQQFHTTCEPTKYSCQKPQKPTYRYFYAHRRTLIASNSLSGTPAPDFHQHHGETTTPRSRP